MPRIRSIKPEFWEDEQIGLLSRDARLLYMATWNMADDEGLLRWAAPYLKANAFMYDDDIGVAEVAVLMEELVSAGLVFPYKGGKSQQSLAWIPTFHRHQKPNRPQPSKLAPPCLQNPQVRWAYAERDGWTCQLCGEPIDHAAPPYLGLSIDHRDPKSNGGGDFPSNLQATHKQCNSRKGHRTPPGTDTHQDTEPSTDQLSESITERHTPVVVDGVVDGEVVTPLSAGPTTNGNAQVLEVFDAWRQSTGHTKSLLDDKRRRLITNALKNYPVADLIDAVRGWKHSAHHRGENDRRTVYNDIGLLLRDASKIEMFRDLERGDRRPTNGKRTTALDRSLANIKRAIG